MATAAHEIDLKALHAQRHEKVAEAAERLQVPGVAVGILADGDEDYVFLGVTSVENPLDVDAATLFQIGSTTKTYTATAMMILADRGLVDLDAPVRTYVPELRLRDESAARTVTVLQLLNHNRGLVRRRARGARRRRRRARALPRHPRRGGADEPSGHGGVLQQRRAQPGRPGHRARHLEDLRGRGEGARARAAGPRGLVLLPGGGDDATGSRSAIARRTTT